MLNKFITMRLELTITLMLDSFWANSRRRHSVNAVSADLLQAYAGEIGRSEARGNHFKPHTSLILTMQPLSIPNIISFIRCRNNFFSLPLKYLPLFFINCRIFLVIHDKPSTLTSRVFLSSCMPPLMLDQFMLRLALFIKMSTLPRFFSIHSNALSISFGRLKSH